ncbi:MAG: selenide, water dikinase SelD, partial [Candidatus Kapabacteria bacterium]|nr:selenide, water dikinase SelD [Candidatus Kapabacteria bacterium]MBP7094173.1 selenide, water dikinase SelD [Candidatus Kapabacteria bacterium]
NVPVIDRAVILDYLSQKSFPGGTTRNLDSYGHKLAPLAEEQKYILCDPQTSGGLLVCVDPSQVGDFLAVSRSLGLGELEPIGRMTKKGAYRVTVNGAVNVA